MKINTIKTAVSICLIVFSVQLIEAQKKARKTVPSCGIKISDQKIIDHLFPVYFVGTYFGYAMSLRYTEPNAPENQINIFHPEPERYEVYLYRASGKSIARQIQEIKAKTKNPNFQQITKQIKYEKIRIALTEEEVLKIKEGFMESGRKSNDFEGRIFSRSPSEIPLSIFDETLYEVTYFGIGNIRLWGESNEIAGKPSIEEPPFIEWMRSVYRIVNSKI